VSIQQLSLAPLFATWQTMFAFARQDDKPVLYRSSDGGRSWTAVLTPGADIQQLVYAPDIEEDRPLTASEYFIHNLSFFIGNNFPPR